MDKFLKQIYHGHSGFLSFSEEEKKIAAQNQVFLTYGEIIAPSVDYLLSIIELTEDDVFLDLGSGVGKLCLQVLMRSTAKKVYGIEAHEIRHSISEHAWKKVKRKRPYFGKSNRELIFLKDNFLNFDFSPVTVIFMCSTCFGHELMESIATKINDAPLIRIAISMKEIPNLSRLSLYKKIDIKTSWNESSPCYIYMV